VIGVEVKRKGSEYRVEVLEEPWVQRRATVWMSLHGGCGGLGVVWPLTHPAAAPYAAILLLYYSFLQYGRPPSGSYLFWF
jgi:hypothetical protein